MTPIAPPASSSPHPLQRYWDLAAAAVQADALDTALQLGLFEALTQALDPSQLAQRLGLHPANTGHLLELLWSIELLQRRRRDLADGGSTFVYEIAPPARQFLLRDSATFCGEAWSYRLNALWHLGGRLRAHVEQGLRLPDAPLQQANGAGWATAARAQIGQEQRAVTVAAALDVLERLPRAAAARQLLDLGGGPGWVAIALARQRPELAGVVFDGPETAEVAQENIEASGLARRLRAQGGDLTQDPLGAEDYDLVWCSSVLHFVPDIAAVLRRIHAAMRPGGLFVCAHAEVSEVAEEAARVLPFYLPMRMSGRHVLPAGAMAAALREAGFVALESLDSRAFPMAPLQIVACSKPGA